ncbi:MAG: hypothetical protein HUJ27_06160 [Rhodobacteraceae bacterium]|nr:hypothetical protein [Paracoccaceae bacterium]
MPLKPREIWEKGTPLDEAWYAWSNEKRREDYDALGSYSPPKVDAGQDPLAALASIVGSIQKISDAPRQRAKIIEDMKADLLEWLQEEELSAFGFPAKPKPARTPRRIDAEFWENPTVDWVQDTAWDAVYKYHRIRIISPEDFPEVKIKPKIGRPSNGNLIQRHAYLLFKGYPEAIDISNKEKAEIVRKSIKNANPDLDVYGKGFGDDALRKHINIIQRQFEEFLNSL